MSDQQFVRHCYRYLLRLYPQPFRQQFGEEMEQTFRDLCRAQTERSTLGYVIFLLWLYADTIKGIYTEQRLHRRAAERSLIMVGNSLFNISAGIEDEATTRKVRRWGGVACFLLAVAFIVAPFIYLVGNLRDAMGVYAYTLADFLYGPVWAASLVTMIFALREQLGVYAPRRMSMALLIALLAAAMMLGVAFIRSANRQYHLLHPELQLENSATVLVVWTTLVTAVNAIGWHCLGWALVLVGSAGWTSRRLPRVLSLLYLLTGVAAWFVYLVPVNEGLVVLLGVLVSIWQGILLWRVQPKPIES